jgi:hypothetical protein
MVKQHIDPKALDLDAVPQSASGNLLRKVLYVNDGIGQEAAK